MKKIEGTVISIPVYVRRSGREMIINIEKKH